MKLQKPTGPVTPLVGLEGAGGGHELGDGWVKAARTEQLTWRCGRESVFQRTSTAGRSALWGDELLQSLGVYKEIA